MRPEYYDIYEELFDEYVYDQDRRRRPYPYDEYYLIRVIRRAIERTERENNREIPIRPDAKYFLMVNFHHLIVKPLYEAIPYRQLPNLEDDIQSDIYTIILEASRERDEEISGHQIMRTIDRVWKNLRTTRFELWG